MRPERRKRVNIVALLINHRGNVFKMMAGRSGEISRMEAEHLTMQKESCVSKALLEIGSLVSIVSEFSRRLFFTDPNRGNISCIKHNMPLEEAIFSANFSVTVERR